MLPLPSPRGILFTPWHSAKFQICRLGSHRNFACVKTLLFKSFHKWPNMANFTTENNTYCFRIGPAFLDKWSIVPGPIHQNNSLLSEVILLKKDRTVCAWSLNLRSDKFVILRGGERFFPLSDAFDRIVLLYWALWRKIIGSLSNNDGDGYKNVT